MMTELKFIRLNGKDDENLIKKDYEKHPKLQNFGQVMTTFVMGKKVLDCLKSPTRAEVYCNNFLFLSKF
jgi:hypothetical protein